MADIAARRAILKDAPNHQWCMFDELLPKLHLGTDRAKQVELTQLHSQGCQTRSRAKMVRCMCDRLVHGNGPPLVDLTRFKRYGPSSLV
jgi:hypothetical protein